MVDESALPAPSHESTDISPKLIWIGAPVLVVTVIALALLVLWLFPGPTVDRTLHLPLPRYPTPELQVNPREDMGRFLAKEMRWLNGTGWVDKEHRVAHIPIDAAMREVASEGIADWPAPPVGSSQPPAETNAPVVGSRP